MAKKLFSFTTPEQAHAKLEELLGMSRNQHGHIVKDPSPQCPMGECRIYSNDPEPYQVWDGPEAPNIREPEPPPTPMPQGDLDRLADLVVKKLLEKGAKS